MRSLQVVVVAVVLLTVGVAGAQQSVELCVALDGSGSISSSDFDLQLEGLAQAVEDSSVVPENGTVTLAVVQFSGTARTELPPTVIDSQGAATSAAATIRAISQMNGMTAIGDGIGHCTGLFGFNAVFQVVDVSTDGSNTAGMDPIQAADDAVAAGVDVINALGVGSSVDRQELEAIVRPQPASQPYAPGFVVYVSNFQEYVDAIRAKLRAEISGGKPIPAVSPLSAMMLVVLLAVLGWWLACRFSV